MTFSHAVLELETILAARRADHDAAIGLHKDLQSRSQIRRQRALKQLITRPDCQAFMGDVKQLCQKTRSRETWKLAKKTLFILDPREAVEMDRKHPFSELTEWEVANGR